MKFYSACYSTHDLDQDILGFSANDQQLSPDLLFLPRSLGAMSQRIFAYPPHAQQEADNIRRLLTAHHIEFFETPASRWGFSNAAIWLKHDNDADQAKELLERHHQEFAELARREYQEETGYNPNAPWLKKVVFICQHIFRRKMAILMLAAGLLLLYLYFVLFFSLFDTH